MRLALALALAFLHLRAELNFFAQFNAAIAGFDERALADKQAAALQRTGLAR